MTAPQVFYKFATTAGGIYPSAAAAHKAAALEITAMNAVVGSNNTQVTVTLTALFLLCGHCVIATAKAPIDGGRSLVYGSDNAGHIADRVLASKKAMSWWIMEPKSLLRSWRVVFWPMRFKQSVRMPPKRPALNESATPAA